MLYSISFDLRPTGSNNTTAKQEEKSQCNIFRQKCAERIAWTYNKWFSQKYWLNEKLGIKTLVDEFKPSFWKKMSWWEKLGQKLWRKKMQNENCQYISRREEKMIDSKNAEFCKSEKLLIDSLMEKYNPFES